MSLTPGINPPIDYNKSTPFCQVGHEWWEFTEGVGLRRYRHVKLSADSGVGADGQVVLFEGSAGVIAQIVTNDTTDAHGTEANAANYVAGVLPAVVTAGNYGNIIVEGYHATIQTNADDDIAEGDALIADGDADGDCNSTAAGTAPIAKILGWATADDVDGDDTVAGLIKVGG